MEQNMNGSGMSGNTNTSMNTGNAEHKPVGPVIGLIVILIVILAGGIYFWMSKDSANNNAAPEQMNVENTPSSEIIKEQSSSDDTSLIEADLNAFGETDINNIDSVE